MKYYKDKLAYFAAVSAFIGIFENFIPVPIMFLRLGFSNIPICLGFTLFKYRDLLYIIFFKVIMTHLFRGTLFSYPFIIALAGNVFFIIGLYPFYKLIKTKYISFITISLIGAFLHNCGQITVAFLFIPETAVFYFGIFLFFSGSIFGFINGVFCNIIYNKIILRFFMDKLYIVKDDYVQCILCPNYCKLTRDGQTGACNIRKREGDCVVNPFSGIISSEGIDPIEKKPLYHFYPGSNIFSIGFFGCTLKCQFCQNYSISQQIPLDGTAKIKPEDIIKFLKQEKITSIAFTYSEPTLYYEWILETSKLCRKNNIKTVLVTNGYLNQEPAERLLQYIDAANIDLKSAFNDFYKTLCKGKLDPVKKFIEIAVKLKVHVEVTTLVITGENDKIEENNKIIDFLSSLSADIPYHISRYHPAYHFNAPPTQEKTIGEWIENSKKKLNYIYGGNVGFSNDTYCHKCKQLLISRNSYRTKILLLDEEGKCTNCGAKNNIHM